MPTANTQFKLPFFQNVQTAKIHTKKQRKCTFTLRIWFKKKIKVFVLYIYIFPGHQRHWFLMKKNCYALVLSCKCSTWPGPCDSLHTVLKQVMQLWRRLQKHQREWNSNYQRWTGVFVCAFTLSQKQQIHSSPDHKVKQNLMSCYGNSLNPVAQLVTSNSSAPDYWHWSSMISCSFFSHSQFNKQLAPGRGTFVFQK